MAKKGSKNKGRQKSVERAVPDKLYSKQPRVKGEQNFFASVYGWVQQANLDEKPYKANSRARDEWLQGFWRNEPHLAGVLNSVVSIDKNRGWSLIGGRNQVSRFTTILHLAEHGQGWRYYFGRGSQGFHSTDLGFIGELGREGGGGPLRALYNVDSARCRLTGNPDKPLKYHPTTGGEFDWQSDDFFRVTPMPSPDERLHGLGFCAVSRCLELAKIMVAVYQHDQEMLGAKMPRGLLLLKNITESQWELAMESREEQLRAKERQYYGGLEVLAAEGPEDPDAKLVALSQLPTGFDLEKFTNLLMYGYALAFGYDPSEFWPVKFGALGRGTETQVQHIKATGKGQMDFVSGYQEGLQSDLPDSLHFAFEQRDIQGEILDAELASKQAEWIVKFYEAGRQQGEPLLDREQAMSLAVEKRLIPEEWTIVEEDVEGTDVKDVDRWLRLQRERALSYHRVHNAIERFPEEPIIKYSYDPVKYPLGRELVLWPRGEDALRRHSWPVAKVQRQDEGGEVLFSNEEVTITTGDVSRAIDEGGKRVDPEFAELLTAPAMTEEEMDAVEDKPRSLWQRILG